MSNIRVRIRNPEAIRARLRPVQSIRVGTTDTYLFDPDLILDSVEDARDWAIKTDGLVDEEDYSSKAWAIGGTGTETNNSKYWAEQSATSASNAATSETNAGLSATSAGNSASTATTQAGIATTQAGIATTKAGEAATSASTATTQAGIATSKAGEALTSANNASNSASDALGYSNSASGYATSASNSATSAGTSATNAQVWAEGTDAQVQALGGIHSAKAWVATIGTVYKAQGSVLFANLPTLDANHEGYVYNISDDFTTTSDFVEGAGKNYTAGTNVVCINYNGTYMWDIIGGMIDIPDPLPAQTGNEGKFLTTDGTDASWKYVMNYIGTYSATTQYHPGDIVQNYVQGSYHKYLCKKDALGQYPDVTNDYWQDLTGYVSGLYQYSNDYPLISYLIDGWAGNTARSVRLIVPQTSAAVSNIPTVNTYSGLLKVPGGIDGYYTSSQVDTALGNKQDTLTAGNGIDITSNIISVTSPALINTATYPTDSIALITASTNSAHNAVAVGYNSIARDYGGVAIGTHAKSYNNGASVGGSAEATGSKTVAIGYGAKAQSSYSIQIGQGTNSEANSLYVATSSSDNYKLLGNDGLIPDARINSSTYTTKTYVDDADNNLQSQIDALVVASDVFDIVGTYAELQAYDISTVPVNDIIKVLVDSTHSNAATYYRCVETGGVKSWSYIGSEGAYYTKSEADNKFVPQTRTVNSKALSSDIALTASDVGALESGDNVSELVNDAGYTTNIGTVTSVNGNLPDASGAVTVSGLTVDQTYDGTSTNAQSGTAVAGAIATKADDNAVVKLTGDQTVGGVKTLTEALFVKGRNIHLQTSFAKGTVPDSSYWRQFTVCDNSGGVDNDHKFAYLAVVSSTDGSQTTRLGAYKNVAGNTDSTQLYIGYNSSGTIITSAPACTNNNCIVTQTERTLAAANDKWGFGNGLKIATKEISPTGAGDTTWNYGITFSATPVVVSCRRSGATTTTNINGWVRGDVGTSSCKFYCSAASTWMLVAIGH